jgi:hypothetical protein
MMKVFPVLFYVTLLGLTAVILSACTGKSDIESAMQDYETRLVRVLEIDPIRIAESVSSSTLFPSKSKLKTDIPSLDINLREFYGIKHCQLAALVAQRNTALCKIQLPSQRFIYEYTLLQTFDSCIKDIQKNKAALSKRLGQLKQAKVASFHLSWVNLIQQSEETYAGFTRKQHYISVKGEEKNQRSLAAWRYLISLKTIPKSNTQAIELESHLKHIGETRLPASLWATERYMQSHFAALNITLSHAFNHLDCRQTADKKKAEILKNVFTLLFVEQIQPIGAKVNQLHYELTPLFELFAGSQLSPELKKAVSQHMNEDFQTYQTSSLEHIKLWQSLFKRCNLMS